MLAFFAVVILLPVMFSQLVTAGRKANPGEELTATLIQPVARLELAAGGGAAPAKGAKTGEQVVAAVCGACHNTGVAGAPKVGDNAGWAPRLGLGLDGLTKSAIAGKGAMPPKGGGADLTDEEIARGDRLHGEQVGREFQGTAGGGGEVGGGFRQETGRALRRPFLLGLRGIGWVGTAPAPGALAGPAPHPHPGPPPRRGRECFRGRFDFAARSLS